MLIENIGKAAMLEQTAEELTECAQACLKAARYMRAENPTYKSVESIYDNLHEEIADVHICFNELEQGKVVDEVQVLNQIQYKIKRMLARLSESQKKKAVKEMLERMKS
jgi:NTP pyrophosphatase (non-canonical NTP hydrolase)